MKKSIEIAGFWFHIIFNNGIGIDQKGNKWTNYEDPKPEDKNIVDNCLDNYNLIKNANVN